MWVRNYSFLILFAFQVKNRKSQGWIGVEFSFNKFISLVEPWLLPRQLPSFIISRAFLGFAVQEYCSHCKMSQQSVLALC